MRLRPRWIDIAVCLILIASAVCTYLAVRGLQKENAALREKLTAAVTLKLDECARVLGEHRSEERDRDFKMTQLVQLESARIQNTIKEICRP